MVTFSGVSWIQILTLLVSVVLPILVALVTQRLASPAVKAAILAFLAALLGFCSELLDALTSHTAYNLGPALLTWLTSFLIAVAMHFGLWKPVGVTGATGAVATAVPAGVGGKHELREPRA